MNIVQLTDKIIKDRKITRQEHRLFVSACRADGVIDREERLQVLRIYLLWRSGKLIFSD